MPRDTVFISHATPTDDEFVRWLGTRLTGHRYRVWADLFELRGGTPFWAAIESCIRERTAKFVAVVSNASCDPTRSGVQNEIALADTIKRQLADDEFIVPIRIDDTPFARLPIQIHRLHTIDFSQGWGTKLNELLDTLSKSSIPRNVTDLTGEFDRWRVASVRSNAVVQPGEEALLTNLLPIRALPAYINYYEYTGENKKFEQALTDTLVPHAFHDRLFVSFLSTPEIQERLPPAFSVSARARVKLEEFLRGTLTDPVGPKPRDARAMIVRMLRESFEWHLQRRGLIRQETSRGAVFFFPLGLVPDDKIIYTNAAKKQTRKNVVGRSEKLGVYWHLGFKVIVQFAEPRLIKLRSYVIFSKDGITPISDSKESLKLRRSFCRSWFNNVWRPLYEAFYRFLSEGKDQLDIVLGYDSVMALTGTGLQIVGPMRMPLDQVAPDPDEPEDIDDEDVPDADKDDEIENLDERE
jgi:TIR domain